MERITVRKKHDEGESSFVTVNENLKADSDIKLSRQDSKNLIEDEVADTQFSSISSPDIEERSLSPDIDTATTEDNRSTNLNTISETTPTTTPTTIPSTTTLLNLTTQVTQLA